MSTISYNPMATRKNDLPILGEGCKSCSVRDKCFMDHCNTTQHTRWQGVTELTSDYHNYKDILGFECYVRKYKHGYFLLVNGEKYKSGEIETGWRFHFYNKDMSSAGHSLSNNGCEITKGGKRYLYVKYLKQKYEIGDYVPFENSNGIMLL